MSGFKLLPTALEGLFVSVCLLMSVGLTSGKDNGPGVKVVVEEGSDAVLPCLIRTKENLTGETFDWKRDGQKEKKDVYMYALGQYDANRGQDLQFKGRVSHFQDQLMSGNASIKIHNVKMADSGNYSCEFPLLQPSQLFITELVVERLLKDRSGEIPGASKPCITTLYTTKDWSLLQCEVRGASPEPKVEWQDSSGNILPAEEPQVSERGGRYYVTLNITVNKAGRYRCVVTQEELSHQSYSETFVFISEKFVEDRTTKVDYGWLFLAFFLGALFHAAIPFVLRATKRITVCFNRGADPEPTTTSTDQTNDTLLQQVGVTGDHQHQNGSSKAPPEIV